MADQAVQPIEQGAQSNAQPIIVWDQDLKARIARLEEELRAILASQDARRG